MHLSCSTVTLCHHDNVSEDKPHLQGSNLLPAVYLSSDHPIAVPNCSPVPGSKFPYPIPSLLALRPNSIFSEARTWQLKVSYWGACETHRGTFLLAFILLSSLSHLTPLEMPIFRKDRLQGEDELWWALFVPLQQMTSCTPPSFFLAGRSHNFMLQTMAKMYSLILPCSQGREMCCGPGWRHTIEGPLGRLCRKKIPSLQPHASTINYIEMAPWRATESCNRHGRSLGTKVSTLSWWRQIWKSWVTRVRHGPTSDQPISGFPVNRTVCLCHVSHCGSVFLFAAKRFIMEHGCGLTIGTGQCSLWFPSASQPRPSLASLSLQSWLGEF